jgi:hypothetical protein
MRIILIPLAIVAVVVAMMLLAARHRPPTPVGPVLTMSTSQDTDKEFGNGTGQP